MTNKTTRRRNAVIAAVAGAALLLGGSTYALWQATANLEGGTITAGDLNIQAGTFNAWDVSSDRLDSQNTEDGAQAVSTVGSQDPEIAPITLQDEEGDSVLGHPIRISAKPSDSDSDWKMVPGDTVALTIPYLITLKGDNLVAKLEMGVKKDILDELTATDSLLSVQYQMFNDEGQPVGDGGTLSQEKNVISYYQGYNPTGAGGQPEADTIPTVNNDGNAVFVLVLYVSFDPANMTVEREQVNGTLLSLAGTLNMTLTQVRCDGAPAGSIFSCQ